MASLVHSGPVPLVEVRRGGRVECVHAGHIVVCDADGAILEAHGDPQQATFFRSSAKPLQALAVVASGAADRYGFTAAELALICASHGAQAVHVTGVQSILTKSGLGPDQLQCGPHAPLHEPAALAMLREGRQPERIHNNCSGKHAGMIATCRHLGWPVETYLQAEHPLQQRNAATVAQFAGLGTTKLPVAVDGCGVPTFFTPLRGMATAFARLANPIAGEELAGAAGRVVSAMCGNPIQVAHDGQFDTVLMQHLGEHLVCKRGAEGVFCAGLRGRGVGFAIKIADGSARPVPPLVIRLLEKWLPGVALEAISRQVLGPVTNTRGEVVGELTTTI